MVVSHQKFIGRHVFGRFDGTPGSISSLVWNEYRTIHRTRGLLEAEKVLVMIRDPVEIEPTNQDRLVHVTGPATTDEILRDENFSIDRVALRLERQVEMFQSVERKESKSRERVGGSRETITTFE